MPLHNSARAEFITVTLLMVLVSSDSLHQLLNLNVSMFHDLFPTLRKFCYLYSNFSNTQ